MSGGCAERLRISYAKEPFFLFVYHDGGLQNKLKLALLRIIRETCTTYGIQEILFLNKRFVMTSSN